LLKDYVRFVCGLSKAGLFKVGLEFTFNLVWFIMVWYAVSFGYACDLFEVFQNLLKAG
jgi:hypothetical protein